MRYLNTRTGALIDVDAPISGEYWEKVEEKSKSSKGKKSKEANEETASDEEANEETEEE